MMTYLCCRIKTTHQNTNIFQMSFTIVTSGRCAAGSTKVRFMSLLDVVFVGFFHLYFETEMSLERDTFMMLPSEELSSSRAAALRFHRCTTHGPEPKHLTSCTTATLSLALSSLVQEYLLYTWENRGFFQPWPEQNSLLPF